MQKIIQLLILTCLLSGCYTERTATRGVLKAEARYPAVLAAICGNHFPPVDSTSEKTNYKPGKPIIKIETQYVTIDCDSLKKAQEKAGVPAEKQGKAKVPCPPCDSMRVDTMIITKYIQVVNKAKETAQASEILKLNKVLAAEKQENKMVWIALSVLCCYTLLRWILRYWGIKLP